MAEIVEDDTLTTLFAQLRDDVRNEVSPPGVDATRRTVRRRRISLAAAAAVAALAVVFAGALLAPSDRPDPPMSATSAPPGTADARDLANQALLDLGLVPDVLHGVFFTSAVVPGLSYDFGTTETPLAAGVYALDTACVGSGQIDIRWQGPVAAGNVALPCSGEPTEVRLTLAHPGILHLSIDGDADAIGRAGVAIVITDPKMVAVSDALGSSAAGTVSESAGDFPNGNLVDHADVVTEAGTYRLTVACAGVGSLTVTLSIDAATASQQLRCTQPDAATTTVELTTTQVASGYRVLLSPDPVSARQAYFAYRLTRS